MKIEGIQVSPDISLSNSAPNFKKVLLQDIWEAGCFAPDGTFYGAHNGKLYKSTDFLLTRTQVDSCAKSGISPVVLVTPEFTILWGYGPKIRRSENGIDFTEVLNVSGLTSWWPVVAQSPVTDAIVITGYAGTSRGNAYRSIDDGLTWTVILNKAAPPLGIVWDHLHMADYTPTGVLLVHCGDNGSDRHTLRSTDDGDTWEEISTNVHPVSLKSVVDNNGNTLVLCGCDYADAPEIYLLENALSGTPILTTAFRDRDHVGVGNVWVILDFGSGKLLAFTSNDSNVREWPLWIVSLDYGRTWNQVFCDKYSSAAYTGITSASHNNFKLWFLINESQTSWDNEVRSFLVSLSGNFSDIGR